MSETTALFTAEELSSIPPEQGKEEKASKSAEEPSSIFQPGKEKASIFSSLPPAATISNLERVNFWQNYSSEASRSAAEPSSIFEQGKEKASIFCSLPPAGTTSNVEGFTHIQPVNLLQNNSSKGFFYPSQASKSAAEPSSIFEQGKEEVSIFNSFPPAVTTSDMKDLFAHLLPVNFWQNYPSEASKIADSELSRVLQRDGKEEEAYEELMKFEYRARPSPKCYGIALDTDMKKMKRGRCKYDFFKEEAISFLEGIFGSSWAEKFVGQYDVGVGNVFICRLLEDELNIVKGKSEVLGVRPVSQKNHFKGPYFEPDPSPPRQFGSGWRKDPFSAFQAC